MSTRRLFLLEVLLAWFVWPAAPALACSCIAMTPCQALWLNRDTGPTVFEATVVSLERKTAVEPLPDGGRRILADTTVVHLKDVRHLLGEGATTIETSGNGASCGYTFKVGQRYVIDATRAAGTLSTSTCSQTKPIEEAGALLEYVASLSRPSPGGTVTGFVTLANMSMLDMTALNGARGGLTVTAEGPRTVSTTTGQDGAFALPPLPVGAYRIRVDLPARSPFTVVRDAAFTLASPHACHAAHLALRLESSVSGTVVDRDRRPVAGARLLLREDSPPPSSGP